jgi:hypothetical protein
VLAYCKEVFRVEQHLSIEDALAWETAKWHELEWVSKRAWKTGAKQFKEEKSFRPGLEAYQWKEPAAKAD